MVTSEDDHESRARKQKGECSCYYQAELTSVLDRGAVICKQQKSCSPLAETSPVVYKSSQKFRLDSNGTSHSKDLIVKFGRVRE